MAKTYYCSMHMPHDHKRTFFRLHVPNHEFVKEWIAPNSAEYENIKLEMECHSHLGNYSGKVTFILHPEPELNALYTKEILAKVGCFVGAADCSLQAGPIFMAVYGPRILDGILTILTAT